VVRINQDLEKWREKKSNDEKEMNERVAKLREMEKKDREMTAKWVADCDERIAKLQGIEKKDRETTAKWLGFLDEQMRIMYGIKAELDFALGGTTLLERMMDVLGGLDVELDEESRMQIETYFSGTRTD
jgi:hypothetical protein